MSDRDPFIAAIAAAPDDDLPRLVFADWLDENGDPDRAEFIRLQIATYRESEQFPPHLDEAKFDRIRELFEANGEAWLRPVYDPLQVALPRIGRPEPAGDATTLLGRLARGVTRVFAPLIAGVQQINPFVDRAHYYSRMVFVSHAGVAPPVQNTDISRGFVHTLVLNPARLPASASLADAMTAEPITALTLNLNSDVRIWERVRGPHLRRLHMLGLTFLPSDGAAGNFRPIADGVLRSEHLAGLNELALLASFNYVGGELRPPDALGVIETLRHASFRTRLRALRLNQIPGTAQFLADPGADLDLRELTLDPPEGEALVSESLLRGPFRERLAKLSLTSLTSGGAELAAGPPWPCLEALRLTSNGLGNAGAVAMADSTAFPAVRALWLTENEIGDDGARALTRSPWVRKLRQLNLDSNPIGDAGAEALAEALDHGLEQLSLANTRVTEATRERLVQRYGPRISFRTPPMGVSELGE
jgi:uncharacterized protein (TIGR02996 family)